MKKSIIVLAAIFIIVGLFTLISAADEQYSVYKGKILDSHGMIISDNGVKYDYQILEQFEKIKNNETNDIFVKIFFTLKNKSEADDLISKFTEDEIKNIRGTNTSEIITAKITEQGFYNLINDTGVEKIYWNRPMIPFPPLEGNKNDIKELIILIIVILIFIILIFVIIFLFLYFLFKKFKKKKRGKIINKKVVIIFSIILLSCISFINAEQYVTYKNKNMTASGIITNEAGVKYDFEILKQFEKIKNNETNDIFVKIFFTLKNKSEADDLISKFTEDEIKNIRGTNTSEIITAKITEQGFYNLINDTGVEKIYWNMPMIPMLLESAQIINATYAWNTLNYTGKGIKICVIDSGVDKNHPFLQGKIVAEKCYCSDYCCPNGQDENSNASDDDEHGTHVIGIIASQNETYRGIAYNASIYVVKVHNYSGGIDSSDIHKGIDWCIEQGVNIISMSIGTAQTYPYSSVSCPNTYDDSINNATAHNIFIVASSGNNYSTTGISYPACSPNVTSVGATNKQDNFARHKDNKIYSNRYETLDLLAPGGEKDKTPSPSEIVSLFSQIVRNDNNLCFIDKDKWWVKWWLFRWIFGDCADEDYEINTYFIRTGGTSMAAPHVAGAVALMLEKNLTLAPNEIRQILKNTGRLIWDPDTNKTYLRIDVAAAIEQVHFCNVSSWTAGACGGGDCISPKREYTRAVNPTECTDNSKCEYDAACESGGGLGESLDLTVCSSGCDSTTIHGAMEISDENDRIYITDSRIYNEEVVINSTSSGWLDCQNGSMIKGDNNGIGIYINNKDGFVIKNCKIDSFDYGIYSANSRHADIINITINNSYVIGLLLKNNSFDIRMNNIKVIETAGDNAIRYQGYDWDSNIVSYNKLEDSIVKKSGAAELIWINWGMYNDFLRNNFSESMSGYEGLLFDGHGNFGYNDINDNNIFDNDIGIYFKYSNSNNVNGNNFCPTNINNDFSISSSSGNSGDDNHCEKPGSWNDAEATGCRYYCDTPANVILLYPNNNSTYVTKNSIDLVCEATDDYKLVNISIYNNISGAWQVNQTKNIEGVLNISIFRFSNITNGTIFSWNCLSYDNKSRGSFANINWSVEVIIDTASPNINVIAPLNYTYNVSSINFNVTLNENGDCEYSLNNGITNISMGTINNINFYVTNSNMSNGNYTVNYYCKDNVNNINITSVTFIINTILPNDTSKFYHKDSSGNPVAWLGNQGNIVLKGKCFSGGNCDNPNDGSLIFRNGSDYNLGYINITGDLCIIKGDCSDKSTNCNNPADGAFIMANSTSYVSYIDGEGDLCLVGGLYENSNP